jgi:aquaporin Z
MDMDVLAPPESAAKPGVINGTSRKLFVELIGTFFLVFTVGASVRNGSSLAPLAIGAVLMSMIYASSHISGGHVNPAVALGGAVMGLFAWPTLWIYLVAELLAGAAAGLAFRALNPNDK